MRRSPLRKHPLHDESSWPSERASRPRNHGGPRGCARIRRSGLKARSRRCRGGAKTRWRRGLHETPATDGSVRRDSRARLYGLRLSALCGRLAINEPALATPRYVRSYSLTCRNRNELDRAESGQGRCRRRAMGSARTCSTRYGGFSVSGAADLRQWCWSRTVSFVFALHCGSASGMSRRRPPPSANGAWRRPRCHHWVAAIRCRAVSRDHAAWTAVRVDGRAETFAEAIATRTTSI